jgi:hypothetical protein
MTNRHALALLSLVAALFAGPALAQKPASPTPPPLPSPAVAVPPSMMAISPLNQIEGELAFLKVELKITDDQSKKWDAFAQSVRDSAKALQASMAAPSTPSAAGPASVLDDLTTREKLLKIRTDNLEGIVAKLKPLYESFNEEQKAASQLILSHLSAVLM